MPAILPPHKRRRVLYSLSASQCRKDVPWTKTRIPHNPSIILHVLLILDLVGIHQVISIWEFFKSSNYLYGITDYRNKQPSSFSQMHLS